MWLFQLIQYKCSSSLRHQIVLNVNKEKKKKEAAKCKRGKALVVFWFAYLNYNCERSTRDNEVE